MDPKVTYIAKTLSRTKRKDYENYVVNAIWNRINDPRLVPVTQQFVKGENGHFYYIDLYFPQLKIGIECDEGYHSGKEQKELDRERELTIYELLKQVDDQDYLALHVDVTRPFDEVEAQIDAHVRTIRDKIETLRIKDGWRDMALCGVRSASIDRPKEGPSGRTTSDQTTSDQTTSDRADADRIGADIEAYFKDREYITVRDEVIFPSNKEVYNTILGQNYRYHLMHGGEPFRKLYTEYGYEEGTFPWFPKLTIEKPTYKGYFNVLSKDCEEIQEHLNDPEMNRQRKAEGRYIGKKRVVFAQVKDPVTGATGYRFVGFYVGDHYDENGTITYKRIDDKFKIIKK